MIEQSNNARGRVQAKHQYLKRLRCWHAQGGPTLSAIILAAGAGERFRDYARPKPLLPMPDGRPLIAWVRERVSVGQALVIVRSEHAHLIRPWLYPGDRLIEQATPPLGQIDSAMLALSQVQGPTLIVYCDVLFDATEFAERALTSGAPSAVVTFPSSDPRYGYWNGQGVVEKEVVSNEAIFGVFYFRDVAAALKHAAALPPTGTIPDLLDALTWRMPVPTRPPDVGVPADYEAFCHDYH